MGLYSFRSFTGLAVLAFNVGGGGIGAYAAGLGARRTPSFETLLPKFLGKPETLNLKPLTETRENAKREKHATPFRDAGLSALGAHNP